jgi:hypothetical protein
MHKKLFVLSVLIFLVSCGGNAPDYSEYVPALFEHELQDEQIPEYQAVSHTANDFTLSIFSDKTVHSTADAIEIWAALEYVGDNDEVTIWHGCPYVTFSIEGDNFNSGGFTALILTSTTIQKGEIMRFYYGDPCHPFDPEEFPEFAERQPLFLPAGEYTITARGAFSLSYETPRNRNENFSSMLPNAPTKPERGLFAQLNIIVVDAE